MIVRPFGKWKIDQVEFIAGSCIIVHKRVVANSLAFVLIICCCACSQCDTGQQTVS